MTVPALNELPVELLETIFSYLSADDLIRTSLVCKLFARCVASISMLRISLSKFVKMKPSVFGKYFPSVKYLSIETKSNGHMGIKKFEVDALRPMLLSLFSDPRIWSRFKLVDMDLFLDPTFDPLMMKVLRGIFVNPYMPGYEKVLKEMPTLKRLCYCLEYSIGLSNLDLDLVISSRDTLSVMAPPTQIEELAATSIGFNIRILQIPEDGNWMENLRCLTLWRVGIPANLLRVIFERAAHLEQLNLLCNNATFPVECLDVLTDVNIRLPSLRAIGLTMEADFPASEQEKCLGFVSRLLPQLTSLSLVYYYENGEAQFYRKAFAPHLHFTQDSYPQLTSLNLACMHCSSPNMIPLSKIWTMFPNLVELKLRDVVDSPSDVVLFPDPLPLLNLSRLKKFEFITMIAHKQRLSSEDIKYLLKVAPNLLSLNLVLHEFKIKDPPFIINHPKLISLTCDMLTTTDVAFGDLPELQVLKIRNIEQPIVPTEINFSGPCYPELKYIHFTGKARPKAPNANKSLAERKFPKLKSLDYSML